MEFLTVPIDSLIEWIRQTAPAETFFAFGFNVRFLLAIILVGAICGAIGSQVVGNRMSFFSDALAHCAFAGLAIAVLLSLAIGVQQSQLVNWMMLILIVFGMLIGLLIAFVHDLTGLASDTVIGVFFAGAIGLGAVFVRMIRNPQFNIESFLFGAQPNAIRSSDIVWLCVLFAVTIIFLAILYNRLVLASVNPSLALSRNVPVRLCRYLFIMLLGLVVNLCLFIVGALLINALLIVPAATAANFCKNLRQLFWCSIGISLICGVGGQFLSWELSFGPLQWDVGVGGVIVVLTVLAFTLSMILGPAWRNRVLPRIAGERPT